MLLALAIGVSIWALIVVGVVALCVQAARADRLQAAPAGARCGGPRRMRRHASARGRPLHPTV